MSILVQATTGIQRGLRRVRQELVSRPFVRHVGVLTVANAVGAALSFAQGILVARWLGPELYGVAALVMGVPSLVYTFFDARSAEASVKFLSEFHAKQEDQRAAAVCRLGYLIDFGVATLAFLGVLAITPWASRAIVHRTELGRLLIIYAAAFLPRSLKGTSYAVLAVHNRFPTVALIETIGTVSRVALVLGFVLSGWNIAGVIWGNALGMALGGLLYMFAAWTLMNRSWGTVPLLTTWPALKGHRREILTFLAYNDLNALLGMIPKQLDLVLLGYFRNPMEVGYYKLAKSLAATVSYIVGPLQSVTYPELARLGGVGDKKGLKRRVCKLASQIGLPLGLLVIVMTTLIPIMLPILVGNVYRSAIPVTQLLILGSAVYLMAFWLRPAYLAAGMVKRWTAIITIFSLSNVLGWSLLVPTHGYLGMAGWWVLSVVIVYVGLGSILLRDYFRPSKDRKPNWDEYTANLASKRGATATDWEILSCYASGEVLDVGCGTGVTLAHLFSKSPPITQAVGVDIGFPGLQFAKTHFRWSVFVQGNIYNLPFKDNNFDFVMSIDVLEHIDNPYFALKEIHRVCKRGGYFFLQTPNYPIKRFYDLWHAIRGSRGSWRDDPTHVSRLNSWRVVRLVIETGFDIELVIARNLQFQIDKRFPKKLSLRKSLVGKLLGQKIIVISRKK